jgi:competence protein ComEC
MTLFYLGLAWLAGIALGEAVHTPWWVWLIAASAPVVGLIVFRRRPVWQTINACALLLALGGARFGLSIPHFTQNDVSQYNDQGAVVLAGILVDAPEIRDSGASMRVEVNTLTLPDGTAQAVSGLVLVQTTSARAFRYGEVVTVRGNLASPPSSEEGFSYREYLARSGIYSVIDFGQVSAKGQRAGSPILAALYDFRTSAYQQIDRLLPEPEASLLQGILLGLDQGISPRIRDDFNAVSASHIIAISGMNIAIVAGLLMGTARRVMRDNLAVLLACIGVIVYSLFVGANPSVLRAAIMSILALIASRLGRQTYGPASLGFSALVMTAIQPNALWDVGFELSFLATCGLVFYVDPLQNRLETWLSGFLSEGRVKQVIALLSDSLVVTVAAQITTTPLIILVFKRFSLVSLPANFLIIPVQGQIMVWGILSLALAYMVWPLAQALAWVTWLFLAWTIEIVRLFAALPYASVGLEAVSPVLIGGLYIVMFVMTVAAQQPEDQRARWWAALRQGLGVKALAGAGLVVALLIGLAAAALPDGRLHVRFMNTGAASPALVTTPSGRTLLIDAGGSGRILSTGLGDALPFWSRSLDVVILTQPTEAHVAALPDVLSRYTPGTLITNGTPGGQLERSIESSVMAQHGQVVVALSGSRIVVGNDVTLTVLASRGGDPANNDPGDPVSLLLSDGQVRILFPGDLTPDSLATLLHQDVRALVLLVADLGNPALTDPAFLSAVSPRIVIVGPGAQPSPDALARLTASGVELHRLDQAGSIELITDGRQVSITTHD